MGRARGEARRSGTGHKIMACTWGGVEVWPLFHALMAGRHACGRYHSPQCATRRHSPPCHDGMHGWTDGWTGRRTDGRTDGLTDGWIDGWMDACMHEWMRGWSSRRHQKAAPPPLARGPHPEHPARQRHHCPRLPAAAAAALAPLQPTGGRQTAVGAGMAVANAAGTPAPPGSLEGRLMCRSVGRQERSPVRAQQRATAGLQTQGRRPASATTRHLRRRRAPARGCAVRHRRRCTLRAGIRLAAPPRRCRARRQSLSPTPHAPAPQPRHETQAVPRRLRQAATPRSAARGTPPQHPARRG
eukprot:305940-Chlamydomonas_euryale.AAC.4